MLTIDEDKMREEVERFIICELGSSEFEASVIEMVWETLFKCVELTTEDDAAATQMFNTVFKECHDKLIKVLKN